jgi:hypothetical protein
MTTQDWINEQKIQAVQDRKDGKDYWRTDNLYTEADLIELLEAFALYNVVGQSEQLKHYDCTDCGNPLRPDAITGYCDDCI